MRLPGQLADARAQVAQQEKTLVEGEAQLAAGEAEYQKEAAVLREAEKEIASGKTSLSMAPRWPSFKCSWQRNSLRRQRPK